VYRDAEINNILTKKPREEEKCENTGSIKSDPKIAQIIPMNHF
jgi:hypothetical protein